MKFNIQMNLAKLDNYYSEFNKHLNVNRFGFALHITSECRNKESLYKHFLHIYFFNKQLLSVTWRTGKSNNSEFFCKWNLMKFFTKPKNIC